MKIKSIRSVAALVALTGFASSGMAVQINEIRTDEISTDVNEYVELKGSPGESLDNLWYIVIGDHSNNGNPDLNAPFYGSGAVEFAFELTGFSIPEDGYFLLAEATINLVDFSEVDFDVSDLIFENSENVTHLLVRNYSGPTVEKDSDQWGDSVVDIDDDNDGTVNETLPWDEIVDGVSFVRTPNDQLSEGDDPNYGPSLGVVSVGPDRVFAPGHIFRNAFDDTWSIGSFSMIGGINLDTPGSENSKVPFVNFFQPTITPQGSTISIFGTNFVEVQSVTISDGPVDFQVVSPTEVTATVPENATTGLIELATTYGSSFSASDIKILPGDRELVFLEDFEVSLGDFLVISLSSGLDWHPDSFGGNGFAEMSGFDRDGQEPGSEDWLISPEIDLTHATDPVLNLATARAYGGANQDINILVSTNYSLGVPDINNWTELTVTLSDGSPNYELQDSGDVDLSAFIGETIRIAFRYTSASSASADAPIWQVHEVYITDAKGSSGPGWELDTNLGWQFRYDQNWVYNLTMGFVYTSQAPWIYSVNFGYFYVYPGSVDPGVWVYLTAPKNGADTDYVYVRDSFGGWFQYSDGQYDNFINPQF